MKYLQQMRAELSEAPATRRELCACLEMPKDQIEDGIQVLRRQGHIRLAGMVLNPEAGTHGQPRELKLYELTPRGRAMLRGHPINSGGTIRLAYES